MENLYMPIYRAKKINSNEYVEGYYFPQEWIGEYPNENAEEREEKLKHFINTGTTHDVYDDEEGFFQFMGIDEIDPTTLAISFPNMLDKNKNPIFASLREDGKGGDVVTMDGLKKYIVKICGEEGIFNIVSFDNGSGGILTIPYAKNFKVIRIQK